MRESPGRTWNIARNTEKCKNEKCTQWDMDYGEKPEKREKGDTDTV